MQTIYKYPFPRVFPPASFKLTMPVGAVIIEFANQDGRPCIWAQLDHDELEDEERSFTLVGTGRAIPDGATYIGTIHIPGPLVWHLFELAR